MQMRSFAFLVCSAAAVLLAPATMPASTITFTFSGSVSSVYDPFGLIGSQITVDDPVSASLRYHTTTADFHPADPTRGAYIATPGWLKIDVDGFRFERTSTIQVDVLHGFVADTQPQELLQAFFIEGATTWPAHLPTFIFTEAFVFVGQSMPPFSLFSSDALPSLIDFSKADILYGFVRSGTRDTNMYEVQFTLAAVPEPAPGALIAVGVLLICLTRFGLLAGKSH